MNLGKLARAERWFQFLLLGLLAPLAAHGVISQYIRLAADDYCTVNRGTKMGIVDSLIYYYNQWTGIFSNFFIKSLIAPMGHMMSSLLPVLFLLLWLGAAVWAAYPISLLLHLKQPKWSALLFGFLLVSTSIQSIPIVGQSFYWTGGSIPYLLPAIMLTIYLGFFVRAVQQPISLWKILAAFFIPFFAGGLSETFSLMQVALFTIAGVVSFVFVPAAYKKTALTLLFVSLVASGIALLIVVAAPGNAVRQSNFGTQTSPQDLMVLTLLTAVAYPALMIGVGARAAVIIAVVGAGILAYYTRSSETEHLFGRLRTRNIFILSGIICVFVTTSSLVPGLYALGEAPPGRVYSLPNFILICTAIVWGSLMGFTLRRVSPVVIFAGVSLVIVLSMADALKTLSLRPDYQAYATEWDQHHNELILAGQQGVMHVKIQNAHKTMEELIGLVRPGEKPSASSVQCAAEIYGIDSLDLEYAPAST